MCLIKSANKGVFKETHITLNIWKLGIFFTIYPKKSSKSTELDLILHLNESVSSNSIQSEFNFARISLNVIGFDSNTPCGPSLDSTFTSNLYSIPSSRSFPLRMISDYLQVSHICSLKQVMLFCLDIAYILYLHLNAFDSPP